MDTTTILAALDQEIDVLVKVKHLLSGGTSGSFPAAAGAKRPAKKRVLSAEARAKIAAAQKRRWAKQKAAK